MPPVKNFRGSMPPDSPRNFLFFFPWAIPGSGRVGSIGSICTFFQKRRSQVSSAGDLLARLCQKLLLGQRKQRQPFSFLGRRSLSLGQWGPAGLLYFCVSDIPSVLVTVFSVLPRKISIFCWLLALELSQGNLGGWWGGSCLGLSCLCLFYGMGWWWPFSIGQKLPFFHDSLKSSGSVFLAAGPRCFIISFVTPSGPGAFLHFNCLIAASVSFMVMGWLMQLCDVGCFCSCASCSLTWQVLSLCSLTLLRQLAASFWTIYSPSDFRTVCAFSGISQFSSLVSFHNLPVSFSMLRDDVFSCQTARICWSFCLVNSALALL